jgi:hypothetical protein
LLDDNKENPVTPVPVKEPEVKEKETETKPEIKDSDISFNFKEMKTNISCESSKLMDGPMQDLANLKVKDFAIKNQKIPSKEL